MSGSRFWCARLLGVVLALLSSAVHAQMPAGVPGGDPEVLKPGDEIAFTQPAVDLLQMAGKYLFSGGGNNAGSKADAASDTPATPTEETTP